jgi:UDP-N-acetyl-2-amino-2-deoxyglucuronate dehydrogenase
MTVRFGVVGCGAIGTRHLAVLGAEPRAVVGAICDVDPERRARAATLSSAPGVADFMELLRSDVDAIAICTPHGLHADMAVAAAEAGKHVLVEKPMALSSTDALRVIEAARRCGVTLSVVKQNRYNVPVTLAKRALDEGWLGRVFMVHTSVLWNRQDAYYSTSPWRGSLSLEGGALYTQASHFLDLLTWWFGDVISAKADVATLNHAVQIEDCGVASLVFGSGVMGSLVWTTCVHRENYEGSITIIAERGTIKIGGKYLNTIDYWDVADHPLPNNLSFVDRPNIYGGGYQGSSSNHDKVVRDFVAAILDGRTEFVGGADGLKSIEAIERIYALARTSTATEATV